ncbi:hypothetical protein [Streptomyces celluloflavus]|uniref:hypothetical protein n=1 Tax=Streptomyces celluloflavus TaxID=58344 RepID=UPI0036B9B77D
MEELSVEELGAGESGVEELGVDELGVERMEGAAMVRATTARERVRVAEVAAKELGSVLRALGITLPSLGIDPVSLASSSMAPLVELGRCNLATAHRLAEVLATCVPGGPGSGAPGGAEARTGIGAQGGGQDGPQVGPRGQRP